MSKCKVEPGQRYNMLTVIKREEDDYISPSGHNLSRWLCRCDCGRETVVVRSALGQTKSCGCLVSKRPEERVRDLTGRRFNMLTVIGKAEGRVWSSGKKGSRWLCRCDCGNEKVLDRGALGQTKSCGCLKKNLVGKRVGMLTVLERIDDGIYPCGAKKYRWLCQCDCGNKKILTRDFLHKYESCGCTEKSNERKSYRKESNLIGKKINMLTVISREEEDYISPSGYRQPRYLCRCDCGNEKIISRNALVNAKSCGCLTNNKRILKNREKS